MAGTKKKAKSEVLSKLKGAAAKDLASLKTNHRKEIAAVKKQVAGVKKDAAAQAAKLRKWVGTEQKRAAANLARLRKKATAELANLMKPAAKKSAKKA